MPLLTNADDCVGQWAPKIGEEAARIRWRSSLLLLIAYLSNLVWIPLVIAGLKVHSAAPVAVGIAVAVGGAVLIVVSSLKLRVANKLTSELLGLRVGLGHVAPPPREREHYEAWCRKYGVTPFAAGASIASKDRRPGEDPASG